MGKRSTFKRFDRDFYLTPWEAMPFLAPFLPPMFTFAEPCAGDGQMIGHLERMGGTCVAAYDIEPLAPNIVRLDAREMLGVHLRGADMIVTNPPWRRDLLHRMIMRFSRLAPTWLLFDANWIFTDQANLFMGPGRNLIHKIVAVGRVQWIEDSPFNGKDDAAWFQIGPPSSEQPRFYPRLT